MEDKIENIDAVILCGGLGTRLASVMGDTPKVMADFDGRPFLDILITNLKTHGCRRIILCTGHQAQIIEKYYKDNAPQSVEIVISTEKEPLGTGGAIKHAQPLINSDPFMAMNGDCYQNFPYQNFLNFHRSKEAVGSLVMAMVEDSRDYGRVVVDDTQRIIEFKEKGEQAKGLINAGVYCFNREVFSLMPESEKFSLEYDCFPRLADQGFYGFAVDGAFFDIGTPDRYEEAKDKLREIT